MGAEVQQVDWAGWFGRIGMILQDFQWLCQAHSTRNSFESLPSYVSCLDGSHEVTQELALQLLGHNDANTPHEAPTLCSELTLAYIERLEFLTDFGWPSLLDLREDFAENNTSVCSCPNILEGHW